MRRVLTLLALAALAGCSGEAAPTGLTEPIRVVDAAFKVGALPGSAPPDGGTPTAPAVTLVQSPNNLFRPGQTGKSLSGLVTDDATAVALRFDALGTGYWLVTPGAPDPATPGQLTWSAVFDVAYDVPPGVHQLRFAAVNGSGASGSQSALDVCVTSEVPDNLNACDRSIAPPAAVLSLAWDSDVDLDLVLITPSGQVLDPKHATTAPVTDAGLHPDPAKDGVLDHDSDANCVPDHVRRENVVWEAAPAPGQYLVYANLFSACGQPATRFTASLWRPQPTDGGTELVEDLHVSGEVLAGAANGGDAHGLYVTAFSFP